jgi:bacillithiol system protein YtxJ
MNWFTSSINEDWIKLTDIEQLNEIIQESKTMPVIIYKHSTRCGISTMAENNLEQGWDQLKPHAKFYYLDLIRYRDVSTAIAETFYVRHQSPQILIIKNGRSVYDVSHYDIKVEAILENI